MVRSFALSVVVALGLSPLCIVACGGTDRGAAASPDAGDLSSPPNTSSTPDGAANDSAADSGSPEAAPVARYVYHQRSGFLHVSAVDSATGQLRVLGSTALTDASGSVDAVLSPDQKTILVPRGDGLDRIDAYSVDPASGWLKLLPSGKSTISGDPAQTFFHPNGKIVYALLDGVGIQAYSFDPATGALTSKPAAVPEAAFDYVGIHPAGRFLYALQNSTYSIVGFEIADDGALSPIAGGNPVFELSGSVERPFVFDPSGKYVAIPRKGSGLELLAIDSTTGALAAVPGSPLATAGEAQRFVFSADGHFLYMQIGSHGLDGRTIDPATKQVAPVALPAVDESNDLAIDPSGKALYVASSDWTSVYDIAADGTLTPNGKVLLGASKMLITKGAPVAFTPRSAYFMESTPTGGVSSFAIDGAGVLTAVGTQNSVNLGYEIAVSSSGRWVYAISPVDGLHAYSRASSGVLQELIGSPQPENGTPYHVAVDPSERFVVVAHENANLISINRVDENGSPNLAFSVATAAKPAGIAFNPSGSALWVACRGANKIATFTLGWDIAGLAPTYLDTDAGGEPTSVVFSPDGQHAFVSLPKLGSILSYFLVPNDATPLAKMAFKVGAMGVSPAGLQVDPSSRTLYVADTNGAAIYAFAIDPSSAGLTPTAPASVTSPANPFALAFDPSGKFLVAAGAGNGGTPGGVGAYAVGASGALTAVSGGPTLPSTFLGAAMVGTRK